MADHWYYGNAGRRQGPCSTQQLRDLAAVGKVLLTDTIWKEGTEQGQSAARVKNLFPPPGLLAEALVSPLLPPDAPSEDSGALVADGPAGDDPVAESSADVNADLPAVPVDPNKYVPSAKKAERKGRALAIKGCIITSQDGTTVQYRKICTTCRYEDPTRTTMKLRLGMTRIAFYCRKCRKSRSVEIQGMS